MRNFYYIAEKLKVNHLIDVINVFIIIYDLKPWE